VSVIRDVESYGEGRRQLGEWFAPAGDDVRPAVVLVHGGFWRKRYDRHLEDAVAADLAERGFVVWNIDYRSSTEPWPATLSDVAAAYDQIVIGRHARRIDPSRIAVVGHSAGGQLAAWLASRHRLPAGTPGSQPGTPRPALCVPQAGVVAMTAAARERLGAGAPQALLGGAPEQVPDRYRVADPVNLLPTGVRTVLLHCAGDDTVPLSQSETYLEAAVAAGDDCSFEVVPGDHYSHLDPASEAVERLRELLQTMSDL
jgi:acetyl esterase/lipase